MYTHAQRRDNQSRQNRRLVSGLQGLFNTYGIGGEEVNAYKLHIWTAVKHNGKFTHNVQRRKIVHARNSDEAKGKVKLKEAKSYNLPNTFMVETSAEYIYQVEKIGTVIIQPYYVYSDGSYMSVEDFKSQLKEDE
jgi:hypothetical protein